ncbi:MAG: hypothetical protein JRD05_02710 [Deltaproteobacteria bacterium]|nr:hypothetical protein [Deltaproteobacteria bacterium]
MLIPDFSMKIDEIKSIIILFTIIVLHSLNPFAKANAIGLPARMSAKAALYIAVRETGISKSELVRRLSVDEKEIRRMLSPKHQTKLPRIEQALSAFGYQLSVSLQKAA